MKRTVYIFLLMALLISVPVLVMSGDDPTVTRGNQVITGDLYLGGSLVNAANTAAIALKAPLADPSFTGDVLAEKMSPTLLRLPEKTPVNAVAASGKLVSTGTRVSDTETVTIGTTVYTFKTTLSTDPAVAYEVLIGADTGAQATNLVAAIMGTSGEGTTYGTGTVAHTTVSAAVADTDDVALTAKTKGTAGNAIATEDTSDQLSWYGSETTLVDGVDGTVGVANETCADASYLYHCTAANTVADANWRRIELGSAF